MCASLEGLSDTRRRNEGETLRRDWFTKHRRPVRLLGDLRAETEHTRWDPKDGELCLNRMKPGETLVEVRSDSDVQIDRLIWV
jgi:hypothetical protein